MSMTPHTTATEIEEARRLANETYINDLLRTIHRVRAQREELRSLWTGALAEKYRLTLENSLLAAENRRLTAALALAERQLANAVAEIARIQRPARPLWTGPYPDPKER